ncbi:hypothetical protein QTJ16_003425 [Diplocarpon rosae]|uniref:Uncharacterized protein n=1 Tax=Diplocarpon rosae TaxID=946125 RepID=A0AAD9T2N3_9HELO|nr:hypothetical protein QTJ16_003425 [Diplocarpon rosae]PBP19327.1 hypothetical protein BUE80_DR009934 [Diplocarpon rosae]
MADTRSKPILGRKNTLQRMLDLEQVNKVNRMKASTFPLARTDAQAPTTTHTSTAPPAPAPAPPPRSILRHHLPPAPSQSIGRAMTAPTVSRDVPLPKPAATIGLPAAKHVLDVGSAVTPRGQEVGEVDSDVSSICHSPGWEDYNGKKRRKMKEEEKERRKRETEGNNTLQDQEGRKSEARNRLSKAPPTSKRLPKVSTIAERSLSAPTLPTLQGMAKAGAKAQRQTVPDKTRSGSADTGLKGFMSATHTIPVRWKSSQGLPSSTTLAQEVSSPKVSFSRKSTYVGDGGFIGGLKLEQHIIREQRTESDDDVPEVSHNERNLVLPRVAGDMRSNRSSIEPVPPATAIYHGSMQTTQRQGPVYAETAASIRKSDIRDQPADNSTAVMPRNAGQIRRSDSPTTRSISPGEDEDAATTRMHSSGPTSRHIMFLDSGDLKGSPKQGQPSLAPSHTSSDPLPAKTRATAGPRPIQKSYPPDARGRASYIQHQRQGNEEKVTQPLQGSDSDAAVVGATKPRSRRGSFVAFVRSRSHSRNPEQDSVASREGGKNMETPLKKASETSHLLGEQDVLKQLRFELHNKASGLASNQKRSSSKGPAFKGLKSAARVAFSRHSVAAPESPSSESFGTALESQSSPKVSSSERASMDVVMTRGSSTSKADKYLADLIPSPTGRNMGGRSTAPDGASEARDKAADRVSASSVQNPLNGSNSHSTCSRADSSEGYSTLDESSNVTTPTASRPSSQKDYPSSMKGHPSSSTESPADISTLAVNGTPDVTSSVTCAAPLEDTTVGRDSCCGTAVDLELTDGGDPTNTPIAKKPLPQLATAHLNKSAPEVSPVSLEPPYVANLRRKPSPSRPVSTPEMQDLSFLPPLKHQALTRTSNGEGKTKESPKDKDSEHERSKVASPFSPLLETPLQPLGRPPPIPISTTKSECSSLTSPLSSQYLQNARLTIPRTSKTTFLPGPHHQTGPDPIAKMLVVCCSCKYFHDMPSKVYECMVKPDGVVTDRDLGVSGIISTSVKCPWCGHGMSTTCCAGYAAVVYLRERLH